jgi:hypothetical protein
VTPAARGVCARRASLDLSRANAPRPRRPSLTPRRPEMTKVMNVAMIGGGFMGKAHAMAYASMPMFFWPAPAIPHRKVRGRCHRRSCRRRSPPPLRLRRSLQLIGAPSSPGPISTWSTSAPRTTSTPRSPSPPQRQASTSSAKSPWPAPWKRPAPWRGREEIRDHPHGRLQLPPHARRGLGQESYIEEGRIGRILNFRGTYLQDWSADENGPLSWRFQKKIAGSGTVGDIGTHVVDSRPHILVGPIAEVMR